MAIAKVLGRTKLEGLCLEKCDIGNAGAVVLGLALREGVTKRRRRVTGLRWQQQPRVKISTVSSVTGLLNTRSLVLSPAVAACSATRVLVSFVFHQVNQLHPVPYRRCVCRRPDLAAS